MRDKKMKGERKNEGREIRNEGRDKKWRDVEKRMVESKRKTLGRNCVTIQNVMQQSFS